MAPSADVPGNEALLETTAQENDVDPKYPVEDPMQIARLGDVESMRHLFTQGVIAPAYQDEEGITPLHWAAINNHLSMCRYLLESGVHVDAKGGEAVATPAMWAAQRCNYYIVHLMLQYGADPSLTDAQGYNLLHLATFDGNVFLLTILLHQNMPIDCPDLQGHTCLMWAAYKGYPACVDLFIRWGASVGATDDKGFTALHWSLVRGSQACTSKLVEFGSDRAAQTLDGKTPFTVATEMNTTGVWHRALTDHGFDPRGSRLKFPIPILGSLVRPAPLQRIYFLLPFPMIFLAILALSENVLFVGLPLALGVILGLTLMAQKLAIFAPHYMRHLHQTPFLAGVFASSCFWVAIRWFAHVLPNTLRQAPLENLAFGFLLLTCAYSYTSSMVEDPGFVPKAKGRSDQQLVVQELLRLWKFDEDNFCTQCMVRRPVRSKHCGRCKRCVAKHDHHCPWINNCVGSNNHRHFVIFILSMEAGVLMFLRLTFTNISNLPPISSTSCSILGAEACELFTRDPFTIILTSWIGLQITWVTMLLIVQAFQIARGTTTYEVMRPHLRRDPGPVESLTVAMTTGAFDTGVTYPTNGGTSRSHSHDHGPAQAKGACTQWKKLLGVDAFMATARTGLKAQGPEVRRKGFSHGTVRNCTDFWCDPAPLLGRRENGRAILGGEVINYTTLYEWPGLRPQGVGGYAQDEELVEEV